MSMAEYHCLCVFWYTLGFIEGALIAWAIARWQENDNAAMDE
jgi:hypothetical protein